MFLLHYFLSYSKASNVFVTAHEYLSRWLCPLSLPGLTWFSIPDPARGASTPAAGLCWGSVIALFFLRFTQLGLSIVALCGTDVRQAAAPCCGYQEPHVPHSVTPSHGTLRDSSCGTSPHTPCPPWLPPAPNPLHSYSSSCRVVQGSRFTAASSEALSLKENIRLTEAAATVLGLVAVAGPAPHEVTENCDSHDAFFFDVSF